MPVALSHGARALLTAHLTGGPVEERFNTAYFYGQSERAGLMTRDGDSFRLTEEGEARRWEFLPHPDGPSRDAMALLGRLFDGERVGVTDENRSAFRELAAAGLMIPLHTFTGGDESAYRLTETGVTFRASRRASCEASLAPGR